MNLFAWLPSERMLTFNIKFMNISHIYVIFKGQEKSMSIFMDWFLCHLLPTHSLLIEKTSFLLKSPSVHPGIFRKGFSVAPRNKTAHITVDLILLCSALLHLVDTMFLIVLNRSIDHFSNSIVLTFCLCAAAW